MSYGETREASEAATLLGAALLSWSCGGYGEALACAASGIELDRVVSGFNVDGDLVAVIPHSLSAAGLDGFGQLWSAGDPAGRDGHCELVSAQPALGAALGSITVKPPMFESAAEYAWLAAALREWLLEIGYDAGRAAADDPRLQSPNSDT